ncbi:MAG: non-ribosomal peptide synthetase, partial [bacterium]|nr:non-ribosomal peptide synthetase [bacterium]
QVKIRGFRIEPGEIDNHLMRVDFIDEAAVIARKDQNDSNYLCAYFVSHETVDIAALKELLLQDLPSHMMPSYFVQMDVLPLTSNGKVDRRALPEPEYITESEETEAPRNETEEQLAAVWQQVLGINRIGIDDDFFAVGGDSIKAIQIISRLQKIGLRLEVSQLFLHKNIRKLGQYLKPIDAGKVRKIDQGFVEGDVHLTPIQHWLFENNQPVAHHFNQTMTLYRKAGFDKTVLEKVFTKIIEHHDALRMVFTYKDGTGLSQKNRNADGKLFDMELIPIENEKEKEPFIKKESNRIQAAINLEKGPLVKLGLFKGTNHGDHLLIAVHHLVIDGISWRIILEDFESGYLQAQENKPISFQEKTDSFK